MGADKQCELLRGLAAVERFTNIIGLARRVVSLGGYDLRLVATVLAGHGPIPVRAVSIYAPDKSLIGYAVLPRGVGGPGANDPERLSSALARGCPGVQVHYRRQKARA